MGQSNPWLLSFVSCALGLPLCEGLWAEEKWCNIGGSKCRGEWQALKLKDLGPAGTFGFRYPIDWNGDGLLDLIHAETNFSSDPSSDQTLSKGKSTATLRYFRRQDDGSLAREVGPSSPDGLQVPAGFVDFADWDGTGVGVMCCHNKNESYRLVWLPRQRLHEGKTCGDAGDELIDFGPEDSGTHSYVPGYNTCQAPRAVDFDADGDIDLILAVSGAVYLLERLEFRGSCSKEAAG